MLIKLFTLVATFSLASCGGGGMPDKWWLNTEGLAVTSNTQFKELISSSDAKLADKHVFIDFYMQGCYWCYVFQAEWNQLVGDMTEMYGAENVEFIKIDGNKVDDPARKYSVQSFPTFVYVQPKTKGMKAVVFRGDRTYDSMKSWMTTILKDLPVLNEEEEEEEYEEEDMEPYTQIPSRVNSPQHVASHDHKSD